MACSGCLGRYLNVGGRDGIIREVIILFDVQELTGCRPIGDEDAKLDSSAHGISVMRCAYPRRKTGWHGHSIIIRDGWAQAVSSAIYARSRISRGSGRCHIWPGC